MESWLGSLVHGKSYVVAPTTMRFYNVAETIKNSIGGLISGFIKGSESKPLDPFGFVFSSKLLAGTLIGTKSSVYSEDDRK